MGGIGVCRVHALGRHRPSLTDLNQLDIRDSFTWGVQGARMLTTHWGAEALWTQQKSALEGGTTSSGAFDFFTMTVRQLQGNVLYQFGAARGKGAAVRVWRRRRDILRADDLQSEPRLSIDYGGGLNYFVWHNIGMRAHARFKPTFLDDKSAGDYCDPFGFCQSWLSQVEFAVGAVSASKVPPPSSRPLRFDRADREARRRALSSGVPARRRRSVLERRQRRRTP